MNACAARSVLSPAMFSAAVLIFGASEVVGQEPRRDCVVPKEPNGLVRGDRIPKGCVLINEDEPSTRWRSPKRWRAVWHSCEYFSERFFFTPTVKKSVLKNSARLCPQGITGRTVGSADARPSSRGFGSRQRNFGPVERPFGRIDRPFGTVRRSFGSQSSVTSAEAGDGTAP